MGTAYAGETGWCKVPIRAPGVEPAVPAVVAGHEPSADPTARPLILIAGISRDAREMYQEFFLWSGWGVVLAPNSLVAFDLAVSHQPDVIATSDRLRPRDGLLLCEQIHADPRTAHIPVVILTTATTTLDRQRARLSGCTALLLQPTLPRLLLTESRRLIARARRAKTRAEAGPAHQKQPRTRRRSFSGS
jgi:two-component system, cell cycle response regulator DivK